MKGILTALAMFFTLSLMAQSWCPPGAEWTYRQFSTSGPGYLKLIYERDTVVLSRACKMLSGELAYTMAPTFSVRYTTPVDPVFTYEENDTVYALVNHVFRPIYFFNAQKGDTLITYNPVQSCDTMIYQVVDSIGTTVINSQVLRFYITSQINGLSSVYYNTQMFVEQIGAVNNHMVPYYTCFPDLEAYSLRCYSDSGFSLYQTQPPVPCDFLHTHTGAISAPRFSIAPNPTTGIIRIKATSGEKPEAAEVFDPTGRSLRYILLKEAEFDVDISDLPPGFYFLQLKLSDERRYVEKVFKQ